jgi:hypothetical protein
MGILVNQNGVTRAMLNDHPGDDITSKSGNEQQKRIKASIEK